MNTKKRIKISFVKAFYKVEFKKMYYSEKRKEIRWRFKFIPRKAPHFFLNLALMPLVFLIQGFRGVSKAWASKYKVESWSSYEIWSRDLPTVNQCRAKF